MRESIWIKLTADKRRTRWEPKEETPINALYHVRLISCNSVHLCKKVKTLSPPAPLQS
ncbi:hypothetical protein [Anabaena azotica]|uniref:Uncharacterized protein n=1 Tax=Anabaena azotica FACHB-119 TaxID=947527 RepID=A0ABR8CZ31_9NOST|nr:hypothetical protein [Anabaena azotica]MBD2499759.1 hypothetical protein [Anabaena azotica FACHB-119]